MHRRSARPRRTQYSSCDDCRKSRVACDSARARHNNQESNRLLACTRCINRGRQCTFEWMKNGSKNSKRSPPRTAAKSTDSILEPHDTLSGLSQDLPSSSQPDRGTTTESQSLDTSEASSMTVKYSSYRLVQTSNTALSLVTEDESLGIDVGWLHRIYYLGFETIFGSWMGKYGNPFVFGEQSELDLYVSIRQVCEQLDGWTEEEVRNVGAFGSFPHLEIHTGDVAAGRYLDHAVEAYAARWLHVISSSDYNDLKLTEIVKALWRRAREEMLKVINRPSYRSMLSLLLFALTPIPAGVSDEEELDGVSGQVCVHAALQQIQILRARQRSLQFSGTRVVLATSDRASSTSPRSFGSVNFINAESTAYWAALTFDTSASLTLSCRPLLSSGLFGSEHEAPWRMVRACSEVFHEMTTNWNGLGFDLTDEKANKIIAAGSTWRLLLWKMTADFKEALRDGHVEFEVKKAFLAVSEVIDRFNAVYKNLFIACYNRIHFLAQETKFRWYELTLHFHLCILMLVDIAQATDQNELLSSFVENRIDAESWVLNCLKFGLANKYTLYREQDQPDASGRSSKGTSKNYVTVPFVSIDPYAHHVVAAVKLMQQAVERDHIAGKISTIAYHDLLSTLTEVLSLLPQGSKSVQIARASISGPSGGFGPSLADVSLNGVEQ